jgi:hypothetical protein
MISRVSRVSRSYAVDVGEEVIHEVLHVLEITPVIMKRGLFNNGSGEQVSMRRRANEQMSK